MKSKVNGGLCPRCRQRPKAPYNYCRPCKRDLRRIYYARNAELIKERAREQYAIDRDKILAYERLRREECKKKRKDEQMDSAQNVP